MARYSLTLAARLCASALRQLEAISFEADSDAEAAGRLREALRRCAAADIGLLTDDAGRIICEQPRAPPPMARRRRFEFAGSPAASGAARN